MMRVSAAKEGRLSKLCFGEWCDKKDHRKPDTVQQPTAQHIHDMNHPDRMMNTVEATVANRASMKWKQAARSLTLSPSQGSCCLLPLASTFLW